MWPSFFVLGAAKSGTTAFIDLLASQPGIFVPALKEPNYFALGGHPPRFSGPGDEVGINRWSVWQEEAYRALFAPAGPKQVVGEGSVIYLPSSRAAAAVGDRVPDARLIVILRDPVERAFSAYRHLRRDGREPLTEFEQALAAESERIAAGWEPLWHYQRLGCYEEQLRAWLRHFPRHQLHAIRYERFLDDPRRELIEACRFVEVEAKKFDGLHEEVNASGIPRHAWLQRLLVGDNVFKQIARATLSQERRKLIWRAVARWNIRRTEERLPSALEVRMRERFVPEVERLEELLGWDLRSWKTTVGAN